MDSTTCRDLCERWENDYIANKNMLAFGEYDFGYDDYSDLIKQSYYFLKEIFDSYIYQLLIYTIQIQTFCLIMPNLFL